MTDIRYEIDDHEIRSAIKSLLGRTIPGGMRSVFLSIASYGKTSTQLRFRKQIAPDGKAWLPSQRAMRDGGQTLRLTSRLRNSISFIATNKSAEWGTNVEYAATHQFGREGPESVSAHPRLIRKAFGRRLRFGVWQTVTAHTRNQNISARAFLGLDAADRAEILTIIADDLIRSLPK